MGCNFLPGIKKIEFTPADGISLYPKKFLAPGETISVIADFTKLELIDIASCKYQPEKIDAGIIYKTVVEFNCVLDDNLTTLSRHRLLERRFNYRITDIDNKEYLIGIDKKPFPEFRFEDQNESNSVKYMKCSITWKHRLFPIELIDL